jgi:hypothetical protein
MPMRALQVRDEAVMKLGTLDKPAKHARALHAMPGISVHRAQLRAFAVSSLPGRQNERRRIRVRRCGPEKIEN